MKLLEGRPNVIDLLKNKEIQFVINTPSGAAPREDEVKIRTTAIYTRHADRDDLERRESRRARHRRAEKIRLHRQDDSGISLTVFFEVARRTRNWCVHGSIRHAA